MAYTPHEWETGDVITATKLNELEQAVAEGGSGYDAEVSIYHGQGSADPMVGTIIEGDYATLRSMVDNKLAPNILVRLWNDATHYKGVSNAVHVYGVNEGNIIFSAFIPDSGDSSVLYFTFIWDSSDVLSAY